MAEGTCGAAKRHQSADLGESSNGKREENTAEKDAKSVVIDMSSASNPETSETLAEPGENKVEMDTEPDETTTLLPKTVERQGLNKAELVTEPGVSVANDDESAPKERQEKQQIQEPKDFLSRFNAIFGGTTSTEQKKADFETLLNEDDAKLKNIYVQKAFVKMLNDIAKYTEFLKLFINCERFAAYNERIEAKYLPNDANKDKTKDKTKKQRRPIINNDPRPMRVLDAPLHCAVRQLNEDLIKWLVERPEVQKEVNLRNGRKETALAILCIMYDWCKELVLKLKTRLTDIEKERETADKMQQIWLDNEKIEVSAQKEEMTTNAPTILNLIEILLKKGADFNIYMHDGALPFDLLWKYYKIDVDVADFIDLYVKPNVVMTDEQQKSESNDKSKVKDKSEGTSKLERKAKLEGKDKSKTRVLKFYKRTEGTDIHVTEELLEIFICYNDFENFKLYWKDFKVTGDNVKKVITLLLNVAVKQNNTNFVEHIIEKASKEIFKLENKATDTQDPTRSVTLKRNHIRWCCLTERPIETIVSQDVVTSETTHEHDMSVEVLSRWRCFKCCQKRHYPGSQKQSETIELSVISVNSSAECQNEKNPSLSKGFDSQMQSETLKQEKNEIGNSQDPCAGSSMKLSMNDEGLCKDNPSATEGAESQTQSETSKLPATDPHTESATSKLEGTVSQTPKAKIEFQGNKLDSQDSHRVTTDGPTSGEQPSGWCCLKCFQKRHNNESYAPSEKIDLKDLRQASRNNHAVTPETTLMGAEPTSLWRCFKMFQKKQKPSSPNSSSVKEKKLAHQSELKGLLKTVCENGNNALLKLFLSRINDRKLLHEHPLLILTIQKMSKVKENQEIKYFQDCATTLIENHGKIRIQDTDQKKNTALHLALRYGYDKIASLLLKEGHGLMGLMNKQNLTPIEYGTTEFWNGYLNKCITINNETELSFNVGFLGPLAKNESTYVKPSKASKVSISHFNFLKPVAEMNETHNSKYRFTRTVNDMTALRLISESKDRKEFLMHPVIIAFITMKWKRLCHWHILNLLLTTITMGTFMAYTLMSCSSGGWKYGVIAGIGACILCVREIMQLFLLRWSYATLENVVDIMNVMFIFKVLECGCERDGWCEAVPSFSSFVFVSLALQATFLLGATWNNLSITLYMFKTVSSSFFYSFLSFSPVIVAFICSFYRMYNEPSGISINNGTKSNSSEENFNNFYSTWDAAIKTLVMTTGEFEAANINYDGGRWLLFVIFLFIAPIVILNLINGLAVSDIADIRKESEFISAYKKVRLLERYERAVCERLQCLFRGPLLPSPFFEKYESTIYVIVNEMNKLAIKSKKKEKSTKEANEIKASNNKKPPVVPESNNNPSMSNNNDTGNKRDEESTPTDKTSDENRVSNGTTGNVTLASNNQKSNIDRSTSNNNDTGNEPGEESTPIDNTTPSKGSAKIASNDLQLIPGFPWLPSCCLKYYIGIRSFQLVLYMTLDQSYVDKARTIAGSKSKNNSVRGTNEPADTEQTDRPVLNNKTAMNQPKTSTLSRSGTGPSVPESRDKQTEMLQEQVRNMIAMLNDMQKQLAGKHVTKAEPTARTSKISK